MAFWNNLGDLWGDVKSIASGHNPMNQPPPVQAPVPGMPGTTGGLPGGTTVPGSSSGQTATPPTAGPASTSSFDLSSLGSLLGGIDWGKLGLIGLGGLEGANAIQLGKKSTDLANQALGSVQDSWNQRAPLRASGIQGMLNPQTNDISSLTAHSGPYGAGLPAVKRAPMVVAAGPASTTSNTPPVDPEANGPTLKDKLDGTTTTVNYGGKQYTADEWNQYLKDHPDALQPYWPAGSPGAASGQSPGTSDSSPEAYARARAAAAAAATPPVGPNTPTGGVSTTVNFGGQQYTPAAWAQYLTNNPNAQKPH